MKKILYFVFFISLFFIVNVNSVKAATGYCEYSLTRFSKNNGIFTIDNEDDATIRFTIDTSKKIKLKLSGGVNWQFYLQKISRSKFMIKIVIL